MHDHSIDKTRKKAGGRLKIAWLFTFVLFVAEFSGGLISNSLALLSDAGHMLGDLAALSLTLFSIFWATRRANVRKTFGYHRAEVLATFLNGALLAYVAFQILWEAGYRLYSPEAVNLRVMMPVAAAGLAVNLLSAFLLQGFEGHLVTRSAFYHVVSDALSSIAVLLSGVLLYKTDWVWVDPAMGLIIAALILRGAYVLLREAYDILMEGSPTGVDLKEVTACIASIPGVTDVHDLHVWTIGSGFLAASAHVVLQNMEIRESDKIVSAIHEELHKKFDIHHTTIQVAALPAPAKIQKL